MIRVKGGKMTIGPNTNIWNNSKAHIEEAHEINIPTFYISKFPITQNLWEKVMGSNPSSFNILGNDQLMSSIKEHVSTHIMPSLKSILGGNEEIGQLKEKVDLSRFTKNNHPVENINYYMCSEFVKRLSEKTGYPFSIPTVEEWEFAARGGLKSQGFRFAGGNTLEDVAWYKGNANNMTNPVGKKQPNELGLYDMSGNVWEWTETLVHDPNSQKIFHMCCGGSYKDNENDSELSIRAMRGENVKGSNLGLRVVKRDVE